ncbi:uncharacterized protein LOC135204290 [Macrobrachium nipponense]|uniref:uncharacterized protein LOC135204290 n=1 Tax=Macrobrachium nipponense TaxID=159736 RepID=UPI0030C82441
MTGVKIRLQVVIGLLVIIGVSSTSIKAEATPESVAENKINFGWPNFFNPEMGMMREKGGKDKKGEKVKGGLDNEVDTSGEEKDEYEELIDYTLKGGLRGTLLLLNSTKIGDVGNLTAGEVGQMTEAASKVMEEDDAKDIAGSEVTSEGVRLMLPIVTKKHTPELGKYGAKIIFYANSEEPTKFIYYGNWCGRGGRSAPVDNLDRCCLEHETCYGHAVRECPDVWNKPYQKMYAWTFLDKEVVCVRSEVTCVNQVCECDRKAALCFQHFLSNPSDIAKHLGTKTSNKNETDTSVEL